MHKNLTRFGIKAGVQSVKCKTWDEIKGLAIVWCMSSVELEDGKHLEKKIGHYVVFDGKQVFDPLKDAPRLASQLRRGPIEYMPILNVTA
jgi:hypothetical protein